MAAIARSLAAGGDVGDVFARVLAETRALLPVDAMGVCWVEGAGVRYRDFSAADATRIVNRRDVSPRLWPADGFEAGLVDDPAGPLDASFPIDREIAEARVVALLRAPVRRAPHAPGLLWAGSRS